MDRKIVKPAQDGGRIWNPEHGRFLPAEGIEVQMTPYWLGLVEREDIVASDLPPEPSSSAERTLIADEVDEVPSDKAQDGEPLRLAGAPVSPASVAAIKTTPAA